MADHWQEADGSFMLVENHCPICAAATVCVSFCRSELETFRAVLGADIERSEHILVWRPPLRLPHHAALTDIARNRLALHAAAAAPAASCFRDRAALRSMRDPRPRRQRRCRNNR